MAKIEKNQDKLDAVYQWLVIEMQQARDTLLSELRMSSAQIGALHTELRKENAQNASTVAQELRYSYRQNQTIYDGLASMLTQEVGEKLNSLDEKLSQLDKIQSALDELYELKQQYMNMQALTTAAHALLSNEVNPKLDTNQASVAQILETLEAVRENTATQNEKILQAVSGVDNVDYNRIVDEVGDKMLDLLNQIKGEEAKIDYDRIINGVAEKVMESLPAPEKLDYDRLSDMVVAKMSAGMELNSEVCLDEDGIAALADKVAAKLSNEAIDYDKVYQAAMAAQVLPDPVDYDRIAEIVEDKLSKEESTYDLMIDKDGLDAIAKGVSEEICRACASCDMDEEDEDEDLTEEEDEDVEEVPERPSVEEELAATAALIQEVGNDLVDAETGLVIRLKRSFTAKMRQSEEKVKEYYSNLKNELISYKRINSNVSWHGDRFNFGRDTVAKININGKTLCFYLALDPNDPEFKETVYHQKDVGAQKAYENTPFMVKVKSDAAVKKALRLVGCLAEKLGTEKDDDYEAVDYAEEFAYVSTKKLFDDGFIKATKEKKVDFDF